MRKVALALALFTLALGVTEPAWAVPVSWTLSNVVFSDINFTTATGGFTFDADTGTYSNVSITTGFAGTVYTTGELSATPFGVDANGLELVDNFVPNNNVGKSIFNLDFVSPLTNAGGVSGIVVGFPSFEGTCTSADCSSGNILWTIVSGSVVSAQATPEPAALALLGLGIAGLAFLRRKLD